MRLAPRHIALGATAAASAAAAVGATAAWAGASSGSWRERIAAIGYAPAVVGAAALVGSGLAMVVPAARPFARTAAALGGAALLGTVLGKAGAHAMGIRPERASMTDEQLPAVDPARAQLEARETLAAIDRSADDIVIWVPGTMRNRIPGAFSGGVEAAFGDRRVSLVKLPTHPDYQVTQGVADSAAAVRAIVGELAADRRPGQRILLAGESQGAWSIGVALEDPAVRSAVDRAVLWGNPGLQEHQFDGAGDGRVLELTDEQDVVGRHVNGDPVLVTDALMAVMDGDWTDAWRWPAIAVNNPHSASLMARSGLRLLTPGGYDRDPHNHREFMGAAARFLADAPTR